MSNEKRVLPEFKEQLDNQVNKLEENAHYVRIQNYMKLLNKPPQRDQLQKHPYVNAWYLPISYMEMILDEAFFGLWETKNFHWETIQNEIVGSLEISVYNPIAKVWLTRNGAAAQKIMMDAAPDDLSREKRNQWALNLNHKKPSALDDLGGFATLEAKCFKNAILSIGRIFGRDVNREHTKGYNPIAEDKSKGIRQMRDQISQFIQALPESEADTLIERLVYAEDNGNIDFEGYKKTLKEVKEKIYSQWAAAKKSMADETLAGYDSEAKIIEYLKNKNNGE